MPFKYIKQMEKNKTKTKREPAIKEQDLSGITKLIRTNTLNEGVLINRQQIEISSSIYAADQLALFVEELLKLPNIREFTGLSKSKIIPSYIDLENGEE